MSSLHDISFSRTFLPIEDSLADRLESHITRRSRGQIRDLHVSLVGGRIVLRGRSRTYHAKQLAQEAVLDVTGGTPALINEIVVF